MVLNDMRHDGGRDWKNRDLSTKVVNDENEAEEGKGDAAKEDEGVSLAAALDEADGLPRQTKGVCNAQQTFLCSCWSNKRVSFNTVDIT